MTENSVWSPALRKCELVGMKGISTVYSASHILDRIDSFATAPRAFRAFDRDLVLTQILAAKVTTTDSSDTGSPHGLPITVPGVSSAGSAAAVVAVLAPAPCSSGGVGPCRIPLDFTGIYELHPTVGQAVWLKLSAWSVHPGTTIGAHSCDARDDTTALSAIGGPDERAPPLAELRVALSV